MKLRWKDKDWEANQRKPRRFHNVAEEGFGSTPESASADAPESDDALKYKLSDERFRTPALSPLPWLWSDFPVDEMLLRIVEQFHDMTFFRCPRHLSCFVLFSLAEPYRFNPVL